MTNGIFPFINHIYEEDKGDKRHYYLSKIVYGQATHMQCTKTLSSLQIGSFDRTSQPKIKSS